MEKLATGFYNLSGGAVDAAGRLYFVDPRWHRIYRWTPETKDLTIVRDNPLDPVNLVFDKAGNLIVVSSGGTGWPCILSGRTGRRIRSSSEPGNPRAERPGMTAVLPANYWVNGDFTNTSRRPTLTSTSRWTRCSSS